jgi:site-specific recombinase XerD
MRRYLDEQQQKLLLNSAKRMADPLAVRDYHWMAALKLTGMRIQEFSLLNVPLVELALRAGWLVSPKEHCKGKRRANEYLVTQPLRHHLQELLRMSNEDAEFIVPQLEEPPAVQPLVWGRVVDGQCAPLSVRSYEARLKIWAAQAGLDMRISPHWLRHTRGMNIMRRTRGKDGLRVAQLALNHSSIRSTGVYVQMSREEYEREIHFVDGARVPRRVARVMAERMGTIAKATGGAV